MVRGLIPRSLIEYYTHTFRTVQRVAGTDSPTEHVKSEIITYK